MSAWITRSAIGIEVGGLAVEDDELRPGALGERRKARRRIDHQRRAGGEEEVARQRLLLAAPHRLERHRLTERDGRRLHDPAALVAPGERLVALEGRQDRLELEATLAVEAAGIGGVAVELDHALAGHS